MIELNNFYCMDCMDCIDDCMLSEARMNFMIRGNLYEGKDRC